MPRMLESLLWCAALATWLMLLFGFIVAALLQHVPDLRQLKAGLKAKKLEKPKEGQSC